MNTKFILPLLFAATSANAQTPTPAPTAAPTPAPACFSTTYSCDTSQLATKSDLQAATDKIIAAVKAIPPIGGTAPTPVPTPLPPAGIFIGTKEFGSLAEAGAAYKPGETIRITKDLDNHSTALVNGDVTVFCEPGVKLTWSAGTGKRMAWGKGIFAVEGATKNFKIENCEISGANINVADGGNGSAVRLSVGTLDTATFINTNFHHNDNGILGGAKVTTLKNAKFSHNGMGKLGYTHNVYFNGGDVVDVSDSYFGPVTTGNLFKSRAKKTTIMRSVFETKSDVNSSYLIDIPNGGQTLVAYSVLLKAPNQSQRSILSYGVEGMTADGRVNTYEFAHNTVVTDMWGNFLNGISNGTHSFHDNTMVGNFSGTVTQTNSKTFADRAAAGLPAAPALPALPTAPAQ